MTAIEPEDELEQKPLDPAMENVRRKMMRLQLVSAGVMLIMLMAVLGAIVYKLTSTSDGTEAAQAGVGIIPADAPVNAIAALPAGFSVSDVALSGSQVLFYGSLPGTEPRAIVFDIRAGRIVADITVRTK